MQRLLDHAQQIGIVKGAQQIDSRSRQQRIVQFERRILGGGTDEVMKEIVGRGLGL